MQTELMEIIFNYKGTIIEVEMRPQKDCYGKFYIVELNGRYAYTLHYDDEGKWLVVNGNDQSLPFVEEGFLQMLTGQLDWEFNYKGSKINT